MASLAWLVLSGPFFFIAAACAAFGVGAVGVGPVSPFGLILAASAGGLGSLFVAASHALRGGDEAWRRTGIMLVCSVAVFVPLAAGFLVLRLDPALRAVLGRGAPGLDAIGVWRAVLGFSVPACVLAFGIRLIRTGMPPPPPALSSRAVGS